MALSLNTLTYGIDLSASPDPLNAPTKHSPGILIIGGGVSGLTTAWVLLDKGYRVTILSAEWANYTPNARLTAQIAGALWEFPPAVCGSHTNDVSLQHAKHWCMVAYSIYEAIAREVGPQSGVRMKRACFFFPYALEEDERQYTKMLEIQHSGVHNFSRSRDLLPAHHVSASYGAKDAYEHLAPIIDTDVAMHWLMALVKSKGATLVTEALSTDLLALEPALLQKYAASAIVNASGLGSYTLANDPTCYPLRGALLRLRNDGSKFRKIDTALTVSADARLLSADSVDESGDAGFVFLLPRNDDVLVLGGCAQPSQWGKDLSIDHEAVKAMRKHCEDFMPCLKDAELVAEYPFAQGLRPARRENVRVEREMRAAVQSGRSRIVHNYGHGGSGWSFAFGCAADVLQLVEEVIKGAPAHKMEETTPSLFKDIRAKL